jgi:hypothetical protein
LYEISYISLSKELNMATRRFFGILLATALTFALVLAGCDNGTTSKEDPALNGTWVSSGSGSDQQEIKLDNGSFEVRSGGDLSAKGTYTADGSAMTMKTTHIYGGVFGDFGTLISIDPTKWYSKNELKSALLGQSFFPITEEEFDEDYGESFMEATGNYTVTGNTLTMTISIAGETDTQTYTKK